MPDYTDQTSKTITLINYPARIVSLVPSQTELLADLGIENEVVGITKFCVHPERWFRTKTRVGGTKKLNLDTIHKLKPDLIIANKEENTKEQVEELAKYFPVWISDIHDLPSAYEMIKQIGIITGKENNATAIIKQVQNGFLKLREAKQEQRIRSCYLIWKDPYMTVGGDTFIHAMLQEAGFQNIFSDENRYPEILIDQLPTLNCQLLLLSSEPYPFKQKHIDELQKILPGLKIMLVDGELFSWYGSRMRHSAEYFLKLQQKL